MQRGLSYSDTMESVAVEEVILNILNFAELLLSGAESELCAQLCELCAQLLLSCVRSLPR